jgi:N-acetyl-gamma-glutamyl-phosphate reductase
MYVHLEKPLSEGEAIELYRQQYRGERFVDVLEGKPAHLKYTFANNGCVIGLHRADEEGQYLIVTSTIDNLIKGASGQAVQCMNAMFGLPEDCGLV